jgi:putative heme iron utilization protein
MNEDHSDALREIAQHVTGNAAKEGTISIAELDSNGFRLLHRLHGTRKEIAVAFPSPVTSAEAARSMFISLLKSARTAAPKAPSDKGK